MNLLEISLYCGLCGERHEESIPMPKGWDTRYRSVSDEHAFCPKHLPVKAFSDSQCPGCVGGWGDCSLWSAFAYSRMELSDGDLRTMELGICPKRTNGTMMVENGKFSTVDLRDPPEVEGGKALALAIREYSAKYHKRQSGDRSE